MKTAGVKTFFEHQSLARRNTKVMVLLFALGFRYFHTREAAAADRL